MSTVIPGDNMHKPCKICGEEHVRDVQICSTCSVALQRWLQENVLNCELWIERATYLPAIIAQLKPRLKLRPESYGNSRKERVRNKERKV